MIIRIKTKVSNFQKVYLTIVLTSLLFCSCVQKKSNKQNPLEKYIDMYSPEIKSKMKDFEDATKINPLKYNESYNKIQKLQKEFDEIYTSIDNNNVNFSDRLKEISKESLKYVEYRTIKKINFILESDLSSYEKSELKLILLEINSDLVTEFHNSSTKSDLKYNCFEVVVVPFEKVVKLGETYKARVLFCTVDTTLLPRINYNGETKIFKNTYGQIEIKADKRGKFKSSGSIELVRDASGFKCKYPFIFEYEVQ